MFTAKKLKDNQNVDKLRIQQEETAKVYADFVKSFDIKNSDDYTKTFIRGGVVTKNNEGVVVSSSEKSSIYKPQKKGLWLPPASTVSSFFSSSSVSSVSQPSKVTSKSKTKEIDAFLEEIKKRQLLSDEKKKLRKQVEETTNEDEKERLRKQIASLESVAKVGHSSVPLISSSSATAIPLSSANYNFTYDTQTEPECSTNLYIGNLSTEVTEEYLCQQFGKFGVITSVKIMYPRTEEEKMRKRNCGFVSFQTRGQAEAAKNGLDSTDFYGMTVRIGWGKSVAKPTNTPSPPLPIGISIASTTSTSFSSSISCVSFPTISDTSKITKGGFSDIPPPAPEIHKIEVKVPKSKKTKLLIDTLAKYVAEEGHPFEQCVMEKESPSGRFRFLYEHNSDDNIYYRWLVYAYAQGDTTLAWRTEGFCIFTGGSLWIPPSEEFFLQPRSKVAEPADSLIAAAQNREKMRLMQQGKQRMTTEEKQTLENILKKLDYSKDCICNAMTYCLDHAYCAMHIAEFLFEHISFDNSNQNNNEVQVIDNKVTSLYLLSDILYNSSSLQPSAWAYRNAFEIYLPEIFNYLNTFVNSLSKLTSRILKEKILRVLRVWEDWAIYAPLFIQGLQATFLKHSRRLKLFIADFDDSDLKNLQENFLDEELDGKALKEFEELIKLPVWLRPLLYEWMIADNSKLERICKDRGIIWRQIAERKNLVFKNLINFELFWNQNALHTNPQSSSIWNDFYSDDEEKGADKLAVFEEAKDYKNKEEDEDNDAIFNINENSSIYCSNPSNDDDVYKQLPVGTSNNSLNDLKSENDKDDKELQSDSSDDIFAEREEGENKHEESSKEKDKLKSISRLKLRQVELEVMEYQINLEKIGLDSREIQTKCDMKRQQLIQNCEKESKQDIISSLNEDIKADEFLGKSQKKRRRSVNEDSKKTKTKK